MYALIIYIRILYVFLKKNQYLYIYIYKQKPHVREHEILPTDTFVELLSFRLPHHQSLHLCKTFNLLNVSMK